MEAIQPDQYALPLVIAVTGHRDLVADELPKISSEVRKFLTQLQEKYPHNRLKVMSPLAEGADMLVAEIALDLGLDLIVPLPKPKSHYIEEFQKPESLLRFQDCCERAESVFELSIELPATPAGIAPKAWERDFPYAQLGIFLSAHCHILLAIWDGQPSSFLGGTAQVVNFHHDDAMPNFIPPSLDSQHMLLDDESDLVYHIVCSRDKADHAPHTEINLGGAYWFTKDRAKPRSNDLPAQHELIFQRSEEFSADALKYADRIDAEKSSLMSESVQKLLPEGIGEVDRLYCIADWLAIHYQRKTLFTLITTHCMAFLMGLMLIFYTDLDSYRAFLIAFLGFYTAAAAAQRISKKGNWHRKYLDYRTLAEGLRVQFYWAAAGVSPENKWKFAHDDYLQSQNPEFGWIRNVMRIAGVYCDGRKYKDEEGVEFAIEEWVGAPDTGQLGYFKHKASDRIRRNRLTENLGKSSLFTSVFIVFVFLIFGQNLDEDWSVALTVIMGSTLLLFAVREGYAYATATKELIKQYEYMLRIYDNAHQRLQLARDSAEQRLILSALGQSALDEHSNWILMHRERSIDESEIWRMGS